MDEPFDRLISPFKPQHAYDIGRLQLLLNRGIQLRMDISHSQGDLSKDEIEDKEDEIDNIVRQIGLGLTGKKYRAREQP